MTNPYTPKAIAAVIVAALAVPILALATFLANEAQILFDMHLEGAALAVYISTFLVVALAAVIKLVEHVAKILVARAIGNVAKQAPGAALAGPKEN